MGLFSFKKKNAVNDDIVVIDTNTITTLVGKDTVVKGTLETTASIRIDGTVKADIKCGGVVVVTNEAHIEGTIMAESIIIAGEIKGDIYIKDKVNIEATGKVTGDIYTNRFVIDENAVFDGKCNMNKEGSLDFSDFEKMIENNKKALEEKEEKTSNSSKQSGTVGKNNTRPRNQKNRKKVEKPDKSENAAATEKTEKAEKSEKQEKMVNPEKSDSAEEIKDSDIEIADIKDIDLKEDK